MFVPIRERVGVNVCVCVCVCVTGFVAILEIHSASQYNIRCDSYGFVSTHAHVFIQTSTPTHACGYGARLGEYMALLGKYRTLLGQYRTLLGQYRTLLGEYRTLLGEYRTLLGEHRTLLGEYRNLSIDSVLSSINK